MDLAMEDYRQALRRMAVLLVALAGLAERAAGQARPLRGFVLWLLRPAEAVAREFVIEELRMAGAPVPPAPMALRQGGDCPAEAMRLASCLRALAAALDDLAVRAGRLVACLDPGRTVGPASSGAAPLAPGRCQASHCRGAAPNNANGYCGPIEQAPNRPDTS